MLVYRFLNEHFFKVNQQQYIEPSIQFIIMANLENESSNPHMNLIESLTSKLQVLGNENRTLIQQRQSFEAIIKKYVSNINNLDHQLSEKDKENSELVQKNREITIKYRKLQLDCQRITEDYTFLYNYVHTGNRGQRDLMMKEMELNNKLNQIHQDGHLTIVQQLKESLEKNNEDIRGLLRENTKLKKDIFQITFQYNQKIANLREEIATLKGQRILREGSQTELSKQQQIKEISRKKIEGLQNQIKLLEREYQNIQKELLSCKQQLNHYKSEVQWLKQQQEAKGLRNDLVFDFQSMKQLLDENLVLKKQLEQERYKLSTAIERDPSILAQLDEINVSNPFDSLHDEIEQMSEKLGESNKQIILLKANIERLTNQKNKRDDDYFKLKTNTIKLVQKLTNYIQNFVPCFNIYGFSNLSLDEEQCKIIQDHSTGIEKEIDNISNELIKKNNEIRNLESKLKEMQRQNQEKDERIQAYIKKGDKMREQNQKLLSTVDMLTKRLSTISLMNEDNNRFNENESERRHQQYRSEHEDIEEITPHQFRFRIEQTKPKNELLTDLIESLQKDRIKMLEIIRTKDLMLAESNAQLSVLRAQIKPKYYQFQTPNFSKMQVISSMADPHQSDQILQRFTSQYCKLHGEIKTMGERYENQILLLNQEFNKKYSQLNLKYGRLLSQNNNLQEKYKLLERSFQQSQHREEQLREKQGEIIQEDKEDDVIVQGYQMSRNDNTSINETTIQTINDLLKRYEKEFNRFASLYQSEIKKTRQFQHSSYQHTDHQNIEAELHKQLENLRQLLSQNKQTIQLLSAELHEKEAQIRSQRDNYEANEQISEQRLVELEKRLNSLNSELQTLQRKSLLNLSGNQGIYPQQPSVLITVLTSKNEEIESLKEKLQQQRVALVQKNKEVSLLKNNINDERSQLDIEQFNAFKKFVQENDLTDILEKALHLLTEQQSNPQ